MPAALSALLLETLICRTLIYQASVEMSSLQKENKYIHKHTYMYSWLVEYINADLSQLC